MRKRISTAAAQIHTQVSTGAKKNCERSTQYCCYV